MFYKFAQIEIGFQKTLKRLVEKTEKKKKIIKIRYNRVFIES